MKLLAQEKLLEMEILSSKYSKNKSSPKKYMILFTFIIKVPDLRDFKKNLAPRYTKETPIDKYIALVKVKKRQQANIEAARR